MTMSVRKRIFEAQNKLARLYYRRKYRDVLEHIFWCNNEIKRLSAVPQYEKRSAEELWHWTHIPAWLLRDISPGCRSLDIGPAYGTLALFAKKFLGSSVQCASGIHNTGFITPISTQLSNKYNFDVFDMNIEHTDYFPEYYFDFIVFTEVLECFVNHPVPTMKKIRKLLKEDGRLYLSTPDAKQWGKTKHYKSYNDMPKPQTKRTPMGKHIYRFNWKELTNVFHESGFTVERKDYAPGAGDGRHFNVCLKPVNV